MLGLASRKELIEVNNRLVDNIKELRMQLVCSHDLLWVWNSPSGPYGWMPPEYATCGRCCLRMDGVTHLNVLMHNAEYNKKMADEYKAEAKKEKQK